VSDAQAPLRASSAPRLRPGGVPNAAQLLEWLEEYQRDLEQEVADVADLIRRLRTEPQQMSTV
jgi:hypothetical protein